MDTGTVIATLSLILSALALVITYVVSRNTERATARPVLVFSLRSEGVWQLQNVGNGPAVSILVGETGREQQWFNITNCYPLAAGASIDLPWLRSANELAVVYTDIFQRQMTTHCASNRNTVSVTNEHPDWRHEVHEVLQRLIVRGSKLISLQELEGLSQFELDVKRNEYFAKHGYIFTREDLAAHFGKQSWYEPRTRNLKAVQATMTKDEMDTANFIGEYQKSRLMLFALSRQERR